MLTGFSRMENNKRVRVEMATLCRPYKVHANNNNNNDNKIIWLD